MNLKTIFPNRLFFLTLALLLVMGTALSLASPVIAATQPTTSAAGGGKSWVMGGTFGTGVHDAITKPGAANLEATSNGLFSNNINSAVFQIGGCIPGITVDESTMVSDPDYCKNINKSTAMNGIGGLIYAMVTTPPASTNLAIMDFGKSLGFISPQAYAQSQGIGFTGLAPILPIWKGFRNVAYSVLAIIMIVIGFMVMFRKKIDPKTVVTVQNALPGIIVTMILITFSYAIAGFMIDLMYLLTSVGIALLAPAGYATGMGSPLGGSAMSTGQVQQMYVGGGFFSLLTGIFGPLLNVINPFSGAFSVVSTAMQQGVQFNNLIPGLISGTAQVGFQIFLGPILTLILLIAFLIAFVRIFFMLLSSYVNIILGVIIAPLQLLLGALPGGDGFGSWAKNMLTNLIAFPITILVLIVANWLGSSTSSSQINALWVPPLLPQPGGGGGNAPAAFAYTIIWLGLIFSIPTLVGTVKEALKSKGLPAGVGAIAGPIGGGAMQALQMSYYATQAGSFFSKGKGESNAFATALQPIMESQKNIAAAVSEINKK